MWKLISVQMLVRALGAALVIIAFRLTLTAFSPHKYHFHYRHDNGRVFFDEVPERMAFESGNVQTSENDGNYYDRIPELAAMKLSKDILITEQMNRRIESEIEGRGQWLVQALRSIHGRVNFNENRLLYKLHSSAVFTKDRNNRITNNCLIKVLQLCNIMCKRMVREEQKEWTKFNCQFSNCRFETKVGHTIADIKESDVVFVLPDNRDWKSVIESRPQGQLWVFHSKEAPSHGPEQSPPREFKNPFNISITYMTGTDIAPAYYHFDTGNGDPNPKVLRKKKLMSWVASNCNSTSWKRTEFVQELQKHLDIDTYGRCGSLECPRTEDECWAMRGQYKFSLALENSQCPEYITEKFWHNSLAVGSVPIVYGPSKEDYERLAPPHSFIHLNDFKTVQEFKDYINLLDHNDDLYLEYFAWRRLGRVKKSSTILTTRIQTPRRLCYIIMTLLRKSLHPEEYPWQEEHPNFYDWWHGLCHEDSQKKRIMDIDV